jgi:hypothetical protein
MVTTSHESSQDGKNQNGSTTVLELDQEVASTKKKKRVRRSQSCKMIVQPLILFLEFFSSDCTTTQWLLTYNHLLFAGYAFNNSSLVDLVLGGSIVFIFSCFLCTLYFCE